MTDRFEIEVDTTAANEKWHVEVEENLRRKADEAEEQPGDRDAERRTPTGWRARCWRCSVTTTTTTPPAPARPVDRGPRHRISPPIPSGRRPSGRPSARDRERYLNCGPDARRLPVLPRHRRGQEARRGTHCRAMEFGGHPALRDVRRGARQRRRQQSQQVLPEDVRQHQARRRRGLPRRGVDRAVARRRITTSPGRSGYLS